jgi:hypothetical protein
MLPYPCFAYTIMPLHVETIATYLPAVTYLCHPTTDSDKRRQLYKIVSIRPYI